jgi:hypothetical protein
MVSESTAFSKAIMSIVSIDRHQSSHHMSLKLCLQPPKGLPVQIKPILFETPSFVSFSLQTSSNAQQTYMNNHGPHEAAGLHLKERL